VISYSAPSPRSQVAVNSRTQELILVVEDEPLVAECLEDWLRQLGYEVALAPDGTQALTAAGDLHPDLVLMDIRLGAGLDGISLARLIRDTTSVPVVFLTGISDLDTLKRAASLAPSGYLLKPFTEEQVAASVRLALLKGPGALPPTHRIRVQDLEIDIAKHRVLRGDKEIRLTNKEFQILACLAEAPGKVLSPATILARAWGRQYMHYIQTVRVHIANLRQKIEYSPNSPRYIETVQGAGYRLVDQTPSRSSEQS